MKKLIALVFVLLTAGIVAATAAFASGANHGFGPGTGVCSLHPGRLLRRALRPAGGPWSKLYRPKRGRSLRLPPPGRPGPKKESVLPVIQKNSRLVSVKTGREPFYKSLSTFTCPVATRSLNSRSCSTNTRVGQNSRINCSSWMREYKSM